MNNKTLITAHAGCANKDLDTLEYIMEALKYDVDIIELDVRFKDGIAVLSHDEIYEGKETNTVKEALELVSKKENIKVNFDIKESGGVDILVEDIKQTGMLNRGLTTGLNLSKVEVDKLNKLGIQCFLNIGSNIEEVSEEKYLKNLAKEISDIGVDGVNMNYRDVSDTIVKHIHKLNKKVYVWTVDDLEEVNKMKSMDVDSITTNIIHKIAY